MTVKQYLSDKAMGSAFVDTTSRQRKRCRNNNHANLKLQRRTRTLSLPQYSRRMKMNTVILCLLSCSTAFARSWKDIEVLHGTTPHDPFDHFVIAAADNPLDTAAPTPNPTYARFSTTSPTFQQSERPSVAPVTLIPTRQPTSHPSESPSEQPEKYPFNDPPLFPQPWYFNYDTRPDARFGPGHHGLVQTENGFVAAFKNNLWAEWEAPSGSDYYWNEFTDSGWGAWKGVLSSRMPSRNQCGRSGRQSPIDVRENGLGKCDETHEVRSLPGDFRLAGKSVHKEILPNKLRLRYERRPCGDWNDQACAEPDPPHADFPNGWGGFADVMHVDFKVPSEHLLNGKRYHGEMQIFHLHSKRRRMPVQTTLIEAKEGGFNWYFDEVLQAFEYEFRKDKLICSSSQRRSRKLVSKFYKTMGMGKVKNMTDYATWGDYSVESDEPGYEEKEAAIKRKLQNGVWDPHNENVVPSIHFYRYEGSLTEPPCGEWVSWFVTDKPMSISFEQLDKLKDILFNHVDQSCRRTSIHYDESVARPIQETKERPVYLCTPQDFGPD